MIKFKDMFKYHDEKYALLLFGLATVFAVCSTETNLRSKFIEVLLVLAFIVRGPKPLPKEVPRTEYTKFFRFIAILLTVFALGLFLTLTYSTLSEAVRSLRGA